MKRNPQCVFVRCCADANTGALLAVMGVCEAHLLRLASDHNPLMRFMFNLSRFVAEAQIHETKPHFVCSVYRAMSSFMSGGNVTLFFFKVEIFPILVRTRY